MSGRLDKSLDEIISTQRTSSGRGRTRRGAGRRTAQTSKPVVAAPVGGVRKSTRPTRGPIKVIPTGPASSGEGKVQVSGFPKDISETMIKEYFGKTIGSIKKVEISYGPGGQSRGVANIIFHRFDSATKAVSTCNGIPVDGKPIKVELILDGQRAKAIPPPKGLSERISHPKSQPKSAATTKTAAAGAARGGKAARARGGRGGRAARPAKKNAEELDAEMVDYWQTGASATDAGAAADAAQPATNGDATMDDEILVG
ncbi:related to RNA annealing protein [Rhynchosporium secalis]|uniref:Related to RNA annealing protein n=1 Tax=Rhynchosporium secalis TaxID=38038 RepID=A0A1E1MQ62_RHYSE|nr:related to RNA annealing protein [Rhynchosporium secalis]